MSRSGRVLAASLLAGMMAAPMAFAQSAQGPCTDDIAKLRQELANAPGLGGPVSEPSAGLQVGAKSAQNQSQTASNGQSGAPSGDQASKTNGQSPGTVGGVAGTVAASSGQSTKNAVASGEVATSSADVRRQSEGLPTAAQQAAAGSAGAGDQAKAMQADKVSQAKMDLQRAVALNSKDDGSCKQAIADARNAMPKQP